MTCPRRPCASRAGNGRAPDALSSRLAGGLITLIAATVFFVGGALTAGSQSSTTSLPATAFRFAYPGESGQPNNLRGSGYFGVDMSLAKVWKIAESQSFRFSWDVFNVTNSVRFDVGSLSLYLLYQPSLGDFTQTLIKSRVMQFGLRYSF